MAKYYILMIAESIKAFSVIGHGLDFKFSLEAKGQETPFVNLQMMKKDSHTCSMQKVK